MALSDMVINDEKLQAEAAAIIDRARQAGEELIDRATTAAGSAILQAGNVLRGTVEGVSAVVDSAISRVEDMTITIPEIRIPEIVIPPITIRLGKVEGGKS